MSEFGLVIFDCDGVLVDSEVLACEAVSRQLRRHGVEISRAEVMRRFLGRSRAEIERYYLDLQGVPLPDSFADDLAAETRKAFTGTLAAMPHADALLRQMRTPYCLASSSDRQRVEFSLNSTGLSPYFMDRIFTASQVARAKPAPDLFLLAAERMQCDAARCLVIEDSISGVTAGKAAGMRVWGFIGGSHYADRDGENPLRAAGADCVFSRLADIAHALNPGSVRVE